MKMKKMLIAMALCAALVAAGCGGDDSTSSTSAETTSSDTTAAETTSADTTSTDATTPSGSSDEIVAACQQAVESQGIPISDDVKAQIQQICEDAANNGGDPEALQAASQKVCQLVVEDNLPEGSARDQALKSCDAIAAPTP
jgi:ABC-type glycerol-3-phosphate transport system substrate-binding protein